MASTGNQHRHSKVVGRHLAPWQLRRKGARVFILFLSVFLVRDMILFSFMKNSVWLRARQQQTAVVAGASTAPCSDDPGFQCPPPPCPAVAGGGQARPDPAPAPFQRQWLPRSLVDGGVGAVIAHLLLLHRVGISLVFVRGGPVAGGSEDAEGVAPKRVRGGQARSQDFV